MIRLRDAIYALGEESGEYWSVDMESLAKYLGVTKPTVMSTLNRASSEGFANYVRADRVKPRRVAENMNNVNFEYLEYKHRTAIAAFQQVMAYNDVANGDKRAYIQKALADGLPVA